MKVVVLLAGDLDVNYDLTASKFNHWRDHAVFLAIVAYPVVRFIAPQISTMLAVAVIAVVFITWVPITRLSLMYLSAIVLPFGATVALLGVEQGGLQASVYWLFIISYGVIYLRYADSRSALNAVVVSRVVGILALVCILVSVFGLERRIGNLQPIVEVETDPIRAILGTQRWKGVFVHANEAGVFWLGATILLGKVAQSEGYRSILTWAALTWSALIMTGSVTAIVLAVFVVVAMRTKSRWPSIVAGIGIGLAIVSQIYLSDIMMQLSQRGSFWWRYSIAETIVRSSEMFAMSPWQVTAYSNWPHSIFLDIMTGFGIIFAVVLGCAAVAITTTLPPPDGAIFGALVLTSLYQPVGALPTAMMICIVALAAPIGKTRRDGGVWGYGNRSGWKQIDQRDPGTDSGYSTRS